MNTNGPFTLKLNPTTLWFELDGPIKLPGAWNAMEGSDAAAAYRYRDACNTIWATLFPVSRAAFTGGYQVDLFIQKVDLLLNHENPFNWEPSEEFNRKWRCCDTQEHVLTPGDRCDYVSAPAPGATPAPDPHVCRDRSGAWDAEPERTDRFCRCPNCQNRRYVTYLNRRTALDKQKIKAEAAAARVLVTKPFLTRTKAITGKSFRWALNIAIGLLLGALIGLGTCDVMHTFVSPYIDSGRSLLYKVTTWVE